jgi:predicted DNA binding CopG/RHH family protein
MAFIESGKGFNKEDHQKKMKRYMGNKDRTKFTIRIPNGSLKKLKKKLLEDDLNVNQFLNDMILKYIEN